MEEKDRVNASIGNAKSQFYYEIDMPFRKWLAEIDPSVDDSDEQMMQWIEKAKNIALSLGKEMAEKSGEKSIVGKTKKEEDKSKTFSSAKALNDFIYWINCI